MVDVRSRSARLKVTAVAPDMIKFDDRTPRGPQLNLFLYRVSENPGWRKRACRPTTATARGHHLPLALNLHYLVTAYGAATAGRDPARLRDAPAPRATRPGPGGDPRALDPVLLGASILPPAFQALTASDLADQVEAVTVTQEPLDTEEMSRLWSAMQAHYRPTAGYLVSVVLIQAREPSRNALPVLRAAGDLVRSEIAAYVEPACCRRTRSSRRSSRPPINRLPAWARR